MRKDICEEEDIRILVDSFYLMVRKDEVIGHIFSRIIGDDWSHHLPVMYQFWETILLNKAGYTGNPIKKHIELDKQIPLEQAHYDRWLLLWEQTVNQHFEGEVADLAKKRAHAMMELIAMKVQWSREGKSVL